MKFLAMSVLRQASLSKGSDTGAGRGLIKSRVLPTGKRATLNFVYGDSAQRNKRTRINMGNAPRTVRGEGVKVVGKKRVIIMAVGS